MTLSFHTSISKDVLLDRLLPYVSDYKTLARYTCINKEFQSACDIFLKKDIALIGGNRARLKDCIQTEAELIERIKRCYSRMSNNSRFQIRCWSPLDNNSFDMLSTFYCCNFPAYTYIDEKWILTRKVKFTTHYSTNDRAAYPVADGGELRVSLTCIGDGPGGMVSLFDEKTKEYKAQLGPDQRRLGSDQRRRCEIQ